MPPSLCIAIGFLTRLPTPHVEYAQASFGRALAWFPYVGAALGALLWLGAYLLGHALPTPLGAVVLVACWAFATGGLHLDGVADTFDAFSGGRGNRERTLEIMRDSRIGAHGAAALALFLLAKVFAVAALTAMPSSAHLLLAAPVLARWAMVAALLHFPYARPQGLGTLFRCEGRWRDWLVGALAVAAVSLVCGLDSIIPALSCLLVTSALGHWANRRLGGLTGDVYGAAVELGELAYLIGAAFRWH